MPWADKLPNGFYRACWRDELGVSHSTSRNPENGQRMNRATARRIAGKLEDATRHGRAAHMGRAPTWGDWLPHWQAHRIVEPSTRKGDALRVEKYLLPRWGTVRLNRISRSDVQAWANELAASDLSAGSIEKVVRLFGASITAAVESDRVRLPVNPCVRIRLPRVAPGHERFLTRAEVDRIVDHLNEPYKTAVLLAAWTGMRWGELAGLHWQRVDLDRRLIDVVETWDREAGRIKTYPKGHNRRGLPIADRLLAVLDAAKARTGHLASCGVEHAKGGAKCRTGLVVPAPRGGPIGGQNFGRRQWEEACDLAGVGDARLHDLRHTFASWLVQDGVPLQEVQRLLGHASIVTTQRYAHLGVSQNEAVLAALR